MNYDDWNSCGIYNVKLSCQKKTPYWDQSPHVPHTDMTINNTEHCTVWFWFLHLPPLPPYLSISHSHTTICCSGSPAYQQVWLRGDPEGPSAHVHEGVRLADKSGWVAIGELLPDEAQTTEVFKVRERRYWREIEIFGAGDHQSCRQRGCYQVDSNHWGGKSKSC